MESLNYGSTVEARMLRKQRAMEKHRARKFKSTRAKAGRRTSR